MYLTWTAPFMLLGLAAAVSFWHSSLAARERANSAALDACERLRLQFLDGTVAFANVSLARRQGGKLALRRTYVFDYTADSIERRQGFVILTGTRLDSVGFANETAMGETNATAEQAPGPLPKKLPAVGVAPALRIPAAPDDTSHVPSGDNVLDFAEWRRRSRHRAHTGRRGGHGERKG